MTRVGTTFFTVTSIVYLVMVIVLFVVKPAVMIRKVKSQPLPNTVFSALFMLLGIASVLRVLAMLK